MSAYFGEARTVGSFICKMYWLLLNYYCRILGVGDRSLNYGGDPWPVQAFLNGTRAYSLVGGLWYLRATH